jgi:hypothetical protein
MAEKTEAQRLADLLEEKPDSDGHCRQAAAELRRLEAVNAQLLEALDFVNELDVSGADDRTKALVLDAVLWKARAAIKAAKGEA